MGGAIFPIENGGAKFTGGVPISLGNLAWGCHIPWGAKYPVTPARRTCHPECAIVARVRIVHTHGPVPSDSVRPSVYRV